MKQAKESSTTDALNFLKDLEKRNNDVIVHIISHMQESAKFLQAMRAAYNAGRSLGLQHDRARQIVDETFHAQRVLPPLWAERLYPIITPNATLEYADRASEYRVRMDAVIDTIWIFVTELLQEEESEAPCGVEPN